MKKTNSKILVSISCGIIAFGFCSHAIAKPAKLKLAQCQISQMDKDANLKLNFQEFDQDGTLPSTARALSEKNCFDEAIIAGQDYLAHKDGLNASQIRIISWHIAQDLALSGDEKAAANLFLAAMKPADEPLPEGGLDWNTYARGSYAFVVKDKPLLEQSIAKLQKQTGFGNAMNAKVLQRFAKCHDKSYREAYTSDKCALEKDK